MKNVKGYSMRPIKCHSYRKLGNLNKKVIIGQPEVFAPVKDVTEDYKKSLLTKKVVEVKSGPTQDPSLWQPQPRKVLIGKRKGVSIYQYVAPFAQQQ